MPNRTVFLVDGFNLYHSLRKTAYELGQSIRWLDRHGLYSSCLYLLGGARLDVVHYFSALAHHREHRRVDTTLATRRRQTQAIRRAVLKT